jgi:hypothetical protein
MFALSYMPPTLSADGSVEGPPADWQTWQLIIQKFIEHYSGIENYNIENVYYEVWNEPDLFGQWKPDRDERNYLTLYRQTALAAAKVNNVNHFYLGGPATTAMYPNWIKALIAHAQDQKLKLDFISWHRYGTDVDQYYRDFQWVNDYLRQQQLGLQTIISEWGYSSELNPAYDNQISAAHTAAVIAQLAGHVDWLLPFELVDGLDPAGKQYWGRWGVLTNPQTDLATKPRYRAMQMLAELPSQRLRVLGQGSWVNAIAATDPDQAIYQVLITNYDSQAEHTETVPVDFLGLPAGRYQWQLTYLNGDQQTGTDSIVGPWRRVVFMKPNEVALLAVKRIPDSQ